MTWRVADPNGCYDHWAEHRSPQERLRLLEGIAELADRPTTVLPGIRFPGRSPMSRWAVVESTTVVIHVYESVGCFDLVDIREF